MHYVWSDKIKTELEDYVPCFIQTLGWSDEVFYGYEFRWNFLHLPQPLLQSLSIYDLSFVVYLFLFKGFRTETKGSTRVMLSKAIR